MRRIRATGVAASAASAALVAAVIVAGTAAVPAPARAANDATPTGGPQQQFSPPAPGSYALPVIQQTADGRVIDSSGARRSLASLTTGRITLLTFMYTYCVDPIGCPLASATMTMLRERLLAHPSLAARVRFVSVSFDPTNDTPEVLRRHAGELASPAAPLRWHFVTTPSVPALLPLLRAWGQDVSVELDARGRPTRVRNHLLKLFLIDARGRVREIYSTAFLLPDVLYNDIVTLAMEQGGIGPDDARVAPSSATPATVAAVPAMLATAPTVPATPALVELGRRLFSDRGLSANGTMACAMCHLPSQAMTSNEVRTSVGIGGASLRRNAPSLYNVGLRPRLFHDGRAGSLEEQAWMPLLAADEMGNPGTDAVVQRVRADARYRAQFARAFPDRGVDADALATALAAYERTLVSANARYDRWRAGDAAALDDRQKLGLALFTGKAGCAQCHRIDGPGARFSDDAFHDTGFGREADGGVAADRVRADDTVRVQLAPGVHTALDRRVLQAFGPPPAADLGRFEATGDPADRWRFRTPDLRDVALTAPYMHDGSLATLEDVVAYYDRGGSGAAGQDPRIAPLQLREDERDALVSFLQALTGEAPLREAAAQPRAAP